VADEVPVPQWANTAPRDPEAIATLTQEYLQSGHDIRSVLRVLFNSDFFKEAQFSRFKSPVELVIGTLRMTGEHKEPNGTDPGIIQSLDPPSVEVWHTGDEWINSGSLVDRVNFAAQHVSEMSHPGMMDIVERIIEECGSSPTPEELVDACLDTIGPFVMSNNTRTSLIQTASRDGEIVFGKSPKDEKQGCLLRDLLKMIVSSREYQLV
jgi:hypothetical protein